MKPIWKWVIGIIACLLVIMMVGAWYLSRHWKPLLDSKLKESVINSTDSLYRIDYDALDFNLITGNASIENLRLIADTSVYAKLKNLQQAPDNIYNIEVAHVKIKNFHPRRILMGRKLNINDIVIDTPSIHIVNEYQAYNDTVSTKEKRTLYQSISNALNEISVGNIHLNNINFKFAKKTDSVMRETALNGINIRINDILIDSLSQFDTTRFYHTRDIQLDMPGFRQHTADSFYYASFDRLQVATADKRLTLTGLKYAPRMNRTEFYKRKKLAKDMTILSFDHIRMEDIDLQQFVRSQKLYAGSLHIDSGTVAVSNDLRYPKQPTNKIGKSPHQQLLKLQQPIKIDSVLLNGVDISYAEISGKTKKEGKITFDRAGGVIYNVTNDTLALLQNKMMTADLSTYLMNTGKLSVVFGFDMLDKKGAFTYKGTLGSMNGRPINRILTPLLNAEVASANIKGLSFDMKGEDLRNWGTLRFDYDNMKVNVLTTDDDGKKKSMKIVSFLANSFIINDSNPDANGKYHRGTINYRRPQTYSFFKTLWKSLLEGIKQTAGISKEREERLMNATKQPQEVLDRTQQAADKSAGKAQQAVEKTAEKTGGFLRNIFKKKDRNKEKEKNEPD